MEIIVFFGLLALPILGTYLVRRKIRRQVRFYESN